MSETPMKVVVNCETRETKYIPLSAEEIAQRDADAQAAIEAQAARDAEEAARQAAKASAESKLAKLGLTSAEIEALLGA